MRKLYVLGSSIVLAIAALVVINVTNTKTLAFNNLRLCSSNSIMKCGALSQEELVAKYDQNQEGDLKGIFQHYGLSREDIASSSVIPGKVYKDGRIEAGGKTIATEAVSVGRHDIAGSTPFAMSEVKGKTFYARSVGISFISSNSMDAFIILKDGKFFRAILTACGNPVVGTPTPEPPVPPTPPVTPPVPPTPEARYTCDMLDINKISRTTYSFKTTAKAENAQIKSYSYDFGDGITLETGDTAMHTYSQPGEYIVKVMVNVTVNGQMKSISGPNCTKKVTVSEAPKTPVYTCDALTATISKKNTYDYTLTYTAENGAELTSVDYDFGDGQSTNVAGTTQTTSHTYAKAGDYTTVATLHFTVTSEGNVTKKDVKCQTSVTIAPEMCTVPGKEQYPVDSSECKEAPAPVTPETPAELPVTGSGIGNVLSGVLGLGSLTAASYYFIDSRRRL